MKNASLLFTLLALLLSSTIQLQAQCLDNDFGTMGIVIKENDENTQFSDVFVKSDGKILCFGNRGPNVVIRNLLISQYTESGQLDTTFKNNGCFNIDSIYGDQIGLYSMASMDQDDKLIICAEYMGPGTLDFTLTRLNTDGTNDFTFGQGGSFLVDSPVYPQCITTQADGKILIAGSTSQPSPTETRDFAIQRFNQNGTVDFNFGMDGISIIDLGANESVSSIAIQEDGKILLTGSYLPNPADLDSAKMAMARLQEDGTLDTSFSDDGFFVGNDYLKFISLQAVIQSDGTIVSGGHFLNGMIYDYKLFRFAQDGTLLGTTLVPVNLSFANAYQVINVPIALGPNDEIIASLIDFSPPYYYVTKLVRFASNGQLDTLFCEQEDHLTFGLPEAEYTSNLKVLPDGSILAVGESIIDILSTEAFIAKLSPSPYSPISSTKDDLSIEDFNVFPNPFSSHTNITYNLLKKGTIELQVTDPLGKIIITKKWKNQQSGNHQIQLTEDMFQTNGFFFCTVLVDSTPLVRSTIVKFTN